jgi:2,3-bisphosphoglycerate-dependent phosphoglycerate mutase
MKYLATTTEFWLHGPVDAPDYLKLLKKDINNTGMHGLLMKKIVLLRHGESVWNRENRFTGWTDVGLTKTGREQARKAGKLLKSGGYSFDIAYTSVLRRAIDTLMLCLEEMGLDVPVVKAWQLNEKHYGALQGLSKIETAAKEGREQVHTWRRSYGVAPPALQDGDGRYEKEKEFYRGLIEGEPPRTECLRDTVGRVVPYWKGKIVPDIKAGKKLIIAAHGNSIRALCKHLDNISDDEIPSLNIPVGIPLVYELDEALCPLKHYYLGDPGEVRRLIEQAKSHGKPK